MSRDIEVCSGAMSWEGVQLSCSLTCSRMYCWQKQQGRFRDSPEHSQPHERMMVDYLQEMSYVGLPESQDCTLALKSYAVKDDWERGREIHLFLLFVSWAFFIISHTFKWTDSFLIFSHLKSNQFFICAHFDYIWLALWSHFWTKCATRNKC